MTNIKCKYCNQLFKSLLIDPALAVQECGLALSKHITDSHPQFVPSLQPIMYKLNMLLMFYVPMMLHGKFDYPLAEYYRSYQKDSKYNPFMESLYKARTDINQMLDQLEKSLDNQETTSVQKM